MIDPVNLLLILGVLSSTPNVVLLLPSSRTERGTQARAITPSGGGRPVPPTGQHRRLLLRHPHSVRPYYLEREDVRRERDKDRGGRGRRSYLRPRIVDQPASSGAAARSALGFSSGRHSPRGAQARSDEADIAWCGGRGRIDWDMDARREEDGKKI
jgi:hypothetical protein